MQLCVNATIPETYLGLESQSIFIGLSRHPFHSKHVIDTEGSFSTGRISEIAKGTLQSIRGSTDPSQSQSVVRLLLFKNNTLNSGIGMDYGEAFRFDPLLSR